jgi:hypothetical protein
VRRHSPRELLETGLDQHIGGCLGTETSRRRRNSAKCLGAAYPKIFERRDCVGGRS